MDRPPRLQVLDSLRGLAAVSVVCHHLLLSFWPYLADPAVAAPAGRRAIAWFAAASPMATFHDGSFAVVVFFVLSGFVLARPFLQRPDATAVTVAATGRYFRLAGPVLFSVLFSFGLLRLGLYRNHAAAAVGASPWLDQWYGFEPTLLSGPYAALPRGMLGTFFNGSGTAYNNVLWTMAVELPGSMMVYALVALFGQARRRWLLYAVGGLVLIGQDSLLFDFLIGVALCDAHLHAPPLDLKWTAWPLLAIAASLACRRPALGDDRIPGVVATQTIAAGIVVAVPLLSATLTRWGDAKPLVWLGRVSFGLYLAHILVLASIGSAVYVGLRRSLQHDVAALAASFATLGMSLIAGHLFFVLIDRPSTRFARWVGTELFAPRCVDTASLPMPDRSVRRQAA